MSTAQGQYNKNILEIRKVRGPAGGNIYMYLKDFGIKLIMEKTFSPNTFLIKKNKCFSLPQMFPRNISNPFILSESLLYYMNN